MHIVQLTAEGEKITFGGPLSTPTSDLTTSKLHWNSVISTPGAKYHVVDVNNFYLNNAMTNHEYYSISLSLILQDVIEKYNLTDKKISIFLYVRVEKGIYGLVQAVIITHTALKEYI